MTRVLVLAGGNSNEREVSLRSGAAVSQALRSAEYDVSEHDPANGLTIDNLAGIDVVFPVLHGAGGEDGSLQVKLESFKVPYVGSGVEASKLCFDKIGYKELLKQHHLPVPLGELVDEAHFAKSAMSTDGFVLKPCDGGSSIDTYIYRGSGAIDQKLLHDIFSRHDHMLLEELISGTEITIAIVGEEALPVIEIVPPESGEFDYDNKYNGKSAELCPPESVSEVLQAKARDLALQAHKLCGCRDFSRTDIMISKNEQLYILETNTIPGMTDQSLLPKAARTAGMDMPKLVDTLVQRALSRKSN